MKKFIAIVFSLLIIGSLVAQPPSRKGNGGGPSGFFVTGQVVEASSNQSIDYATVSIYASDTEELITGTTTADGGIFRLRSESSLRKRDRRRSLSWISESSMSVMTLLVVEEVPWKC